MTLTIKKLLIIGLFIFTSAAQVLAKTDSPTAALEPIKIVAPNYPLGAARKKIQGMVKVLFNVYPDGSTRDIFIVDDFPKDVFVKAAVKALVQYQFEPLDAAKVNSEIPYQSATQTISFKLSHSSGFFNPAQRDYLKKTKKLALQGDLKAKKILVLILNIFPDDSEIIEKHYIDQWMQELAEKGDAEIQYLYAYSFSALNKQEAFNWLLKSALKNYAKAQISLYQYIKYNEINNTSGHNAFYWLLQSLKNGNASAGIVYAKEIIDNDKASEKDVKNALNYLEKYAKKLGNTPQFFQYKALLLDKTGHYTNAYAQIKLAIKHAKKSKWNLDDLKQQKKAIQQHKKG